MAQHIEITIGTTKPDKPNATASENEKHTTPNIKHATRT